MNILLLAAGKGSRFTDVGYPPKPIIDVNGKPMWEAVLENFLDCFNPEIRDKLNITVVTKSGYDISSEKYKVFKVGDPQYGAAYSAMEIAEYLPQDKPLWIANCDQFIFNPYHNLNYIFEFSDGGLLEFIDANKEWKWGHSVYDNFGNISAIIEKIPVTPNSHTGHYYWKRTSDFVYYAQDMINRGIKTNDEYFISPIYNLMIADGKTIRGCLVNNFVGIGVPEDLENFLKNERN